LKNIINSTRGAALVEFAIIAPLLFVILFAIIEFGAILYNQAIITNASREAARYAATYYINPSNATSARPTCAQLQTYVSNYINARILTFGNSSLFSPATDVKCGSAKTVSAPPYDNYSGYAGYVDAVTIQYRYNFWVLGNVIPLISGSLPNYLTLTAATAMRDENQN
jgi:Flp pilus assembly protein TadG